MKDVKIGHVDGFADVDPVLLPSVVQQVASLVLEDGNIQDLRRDARDGCWRRRP